MVNAGRLNWVFWKIYTNGGLVGLGEGSSAASGDPQSRGSRFPPAFGTPGSAVGVVVCLMLYHL
jgi:L-alanine-DL-glutamate epimerase-like enolase superfamily enzyme